VGQHSGEEFDGGSRYVEGLLIAGDEQADDVVMVGGEVVMHSREDLASPDNVAVVGRSAAM
jgi:hypothetical protein